MLTGAVMFAMCVLVSGVSGSVCKYEYDYNENAKVWLKLHTNPANWVDARQQCYKEGAVLASPENETLWSAMQTVYGGDFENLIWTGIHASFSARKGDYHSIKGTPLSRLHVVWAPDEPGDLGNSKNCLVMMPNGTLTDVDCYEVYPFVCYAKQYVKCEAINTGYTYNNLTGKCYKFHKDLKDWNGAFAVCSREGGHLSIINGETEARVLVQLCNMNADNITKEFIHSAFTEWSHGKWMTIHGETLEEAGWSLFKSKATDHEEGPDCIKRCGGMYKNDGYLVDGLCSDLKNFICEKKPHRQYSEASIQGDIYFV